MSTGIFLSSFTTNVYLFVLLYNVSIGAAFAVGSATVMMPAWTLLPGHKITVTGIISSASAISGAIFSFMTYQIVNPDNLLPNIEVPNGLVFDLYFSKEIAMQTPYMIRFISYTVLGIGLIAVILMQNIRNYQRAKAA